MHLLFPSDPFNTSLPDDMFAEEFAVARSFGFGCSVCSLEDFERGVFRPRPAIPAGAKVLYRGWMFTVENYEQFHAAIINADGIPITSPTQYRHCHHLPEWYPLCADVTPETIIVPRNADVVSALAGVQWFGYFVKDYVKSLTTDRGSVARTPNEVGDIVALIEEYRGAVEGGICIRRLEALRPETEERYFVFNGRAHARVGEPPMLAQELAGRIDSPFFSIDLILSESGELRLVELGDGQVSDRKRWPAERLVAILSTG